MDIVLVKVEECKKDVLYRLLQYSLFEESLSDQNDMNEDARFEYPWFENYFTEEDRDAYFIRDRATERLLGFIMINTYVQKWASGHSIAEFMVLPKFRRNKIGREAAFACFKRYPGNWEISPSHGSEQAYLFWKHVVNEYMGENNQYKDGIFLFCNYK